ncbi:hypothetical protein ACFOWB_14235 [Chenggangzhangella methanolivorans]|uniref:hypothetical protein n=1 Tax=Chenggangzhangella methanolivorans TaxID=1437009 RepID=UPI0036094D69
MFFGGAPLWHASVVLWDRLTRRPKPVSSWTQADRSRAETVASNVLAGVGIPDRTRSETFELGLHVRRETTGQERDSVFKTPRGRRAAWVHERG